MEDFIFDLDKIEDDAFITKTTKRTQVQREEYKEALFNLDLLPSDDVMELEPNVISCVTTDKNLIRKNSVILDQPFAEFPGIFDDTLRVLIERLRITNVIDFGSGMAKRMCSITKVIEHVEFKKYRTMCTCGCGIVPFITPFHKHMDAEAVVCINSLQNDHVMWQRLFLQQVKFYAKILLVVVPVKLGADEYDPMHVIMAEFPNVQEGYLSAACAHKYYYYNPNSVVAQVDGEINVSAGGQPTVREIKKGKYCNKILQSYSNLGIEKHVKLRSSVLIAMKNGKVQVVAKDGGCVDFLAAGHVKWGELPKSAMQREWREEVISPPPKFIYVGRIDATVGYAQAYVYTAQVGEIKCEPSRGRVRDLRLTDIIRNDMIPALLMMKQFGLKDVDVVVNFNLMRHVHQGGLQLSLAEKTKIVRGRRTVYEMIKTVDRIQVILQDQVSVGDMITVPSNRWQTQVSKTFKLMAGGREIGVANYAGGQKGKIFLKVDRVFDVSQQNQFKMFSVERDFVFVQENFTGIKYVQSVLGCSSDEALKLIRASSILPRQQPQSDQNISDVDLNVGGMTTVSLEGLDHKEDVQMQL